MGYDAFKTAQWLSGDELKQAVFQLMSAHPATAAHGRVILRSTIDSLLREGIGVVTNPPSSVAVGYRQVLSLYMASLLKLNGANLAAIKQEIASRDDAKLEMLVRAVVSRMKADAPAAPPVAGGTGQAPAVEEAGARGGHATAEQSAIDDESAPPAPDPRGGAGRGRAPVPGAGTPFGGAAGRPGAAPAPATPATWVRVQVSDGFEAHIRADLYARMLTTKRTDELLRAFRESLDGLTQAR